MNFQDFLNEGKKITLKRRYTENHPAVTVGKSARIRNKMLEAIADGQITQEEFNNILKEFSKDSSKWMRRNSKFFNVSEEGITLSKFGKRALKQIIVNEAEMINEGQFSWMTSDTGRQIGSERENTITVYMYDNEGNRWEEKRYEGYGEFGGMDYYELLAKMNGYSEDDLDGKGGIGNDLRGIGIDLAFDQKKWKPRNGKKVLFPALVEDPRYNWKRHDFTQEADTDPNQSWYEEPEYDEEYWESRKVSEGRAFVAAAKKAKEEGKDEFEFDGKTYPVTIKENKESKNNNKEMKNTFVYESFSGFVSSLNENKYAKAGKLGYNDQFLGRQSLSKTLSLDLGLNPKNEFGGGDWLGFDHISLYATGGKKKGTILDDALSGKYTYDELKAAAAEFLGLKESVLCEATVTMDAMDPDNKDFKKFLKKHKVTIIDKTEDGPSGSPEITMQGKRKDLEAVLADEEYGWADPDLAEYIEESVAITEAFQSMKLQSILTGAGSMPKDFAKAFYGMTKLQLDKITDADIIEMDPEAARKEKRNNAVYLYFTNNEKENPYAGRNSWGVSTIPANTLLAATDGQNEWLASGWQNRFSSKDRSKTLKTSKKQDAVGFGKSDGRDTWGTGISSITKVAELADRAYVLDLDILRARYSTLAKRDERSAAKKGATAFKNDEDFKTENLNRYHMILADRAAKMPIDEEVKKAIDIVADQIKAGLASGKTGKYSDVIIGEDPKGREVRLRDASNAMSNLLDDFNRYVDYTNQAEKEKEAGYGGDYYSREVKNYAKSIKDRINKIKNMDYVW